jgi:uncharacterized membrane protein|nr:MAG TPA: hypothetical protein [Caudoviricetes sp.]
MGCIAGSGKKGYLINKIKQLTNKYKNSRLYSKNISQLEKILNKLEKEAKQNGKNQGNY